MIIFSKNTSHSFSLDKNVTNLLKFFACILIALAHYSGYALANGVSSSFVYNFIAAFGGYVGVALFFFFSGYGLMKSEQKKKSIKLTDFFTKRLRRTYFPAVLVSALWLIIAYFIDLTMLSNNNYIWGVFWNFNDEVMWFVKVIIIMYLIFFIYRYIVVIYSSSTDFYRFLFLIVVAFASYLCIRLVFDAYAAASVPFFFIGIAVADFNEIFRRITTSFVVVCGFSILILLLMYYFRSENFVLHCCINYIVVFFMLVLFSRFDIRIAQMPRWISDTSYDVYLVHYKTHLLNISLFAVDTIYTFVIGTVITTLIFNKLRKVFHI